METTARADGQREAKLDLLHASISDLQHALRGGSLSAVALLEACNKRIEEVNDTLHAVISIDKTARQQAERCDEALKKKGQILGPLHGVCSFPTVISTFTVLFHVCGAATDPRPDQRPHRCVRASNNTR